MDTGTRGVMENWALHVIYHTLHLIAWEFFYFVRTAGVEALKMLRSLKFLLESDKTGHWV